MEQLRLNPREDNEGQFGESSLKWNELFVNNINETSFATIKKSVSGYSFTGSFLETVVPIPDEMKGRVTFASALATEDPDGFLGEVWTRHDADNFYVGSSGSYTGLFTISVFLRV